MKNIFQLLRTLLLALVLSIGISYAYATWSDPTATPPNINASAPINISTAPQVKGGGGLGDFGVSGILATYLKLVVSAPAITSDTEIGSFSAPGSSSGVGYTTFGSGATGGGFVGWDYANGGLAVNAHSSGGSVGGIFVQRVDNSHSNVGIGTVSPGAKLDVAGTVAINQNRLYFAANGDTNHYIEMTNSILPNVMRLHELGSIYLDTPAVGIGVVSPGAKLDVAGAVKVGDSATCGAAQAGAIRYNSGNFQGCNGATWIALSGGGSYTPGSQTWTTVGPINPPFEVPFGVTSLKVTMAGGGGGGEGGNNNAGGSGGGGGGGYSQYVMTGVTKGQIINGYVGDGGSPGGYSVGNPWAGNGQNTTFGSLTATGGGAGQRDPGENILDVGGAGGTPGGQQGGSEGAGGGFGGNSGAGQGLGGATRGDPGGTYGGGGGGGDPSSSPSPKSGAQGWIKVEW